MKFKRGLRIGPTGGVCCRHSYRLRTIILGLCALALGATIAARAAAPVITNFTMVGTTPQFAIQSDVGITNQIQYCTNLSQTYWVTLTNLLVAQSSYWFADEAAPPAAQRFYRVLVRVSLPPPTNMALIPTGIFTMGNCMSSSEGDADELPLHTVFVSAFYMDNNEVTKVLWNDVYNWAITNGYTFDYAGSGKASNHPVQNIDWYDCVKWCNARSEKEGRVPAYYTDAGLTARYRTGQVNVQANWVNWSSGYRLPTEAEWEKAARGGASAQRFPWADTDQITHSRANYYSSANYGYDTSTTRGHHPTFNDGVYPYTSPVGYFSANGYGLYDMAGNVWEWCWDWYDPYTSDSQSDPRGPDSISMRVNRGGSWDSITLLCRTAYRYAYTPDTIYYDLGFRSVLPAN